MAGFGGAAVLVSMTHFEEEEFYFLRFAWAREKEEAKAGRQRVRNLNSVAVSEASLWVLFSEPQHSRYL